MATNDAPDTPEKRYRIGDRTPDGRYPVTVDGKLIGHIHRWHGDWHARVLGQVEESQHEDRDKAAAHLDTVTQSGAALPQTEQAGDMAPEGIVPWLHPRMAPTRRNILSAGICLGRLDEIAWSPKHGYPGSDNPFEMEDLICGWVGNRWWSHLRGRNGDPTPRPAWRHEGCTAPFEEQAARVAELVGKRPTQCPCETGHPTDREAVTGLLDEADSARKAGDIEALRGHLTRLLGPCPAAPTRAAVMRDIVKPPQKG